MPVFYLVYKVQQVSVVVVSVLVSCPHDQDRPALAVEAAQVHLSGRVLLPDHVHLLRKHLLDGKGSETPGIAAVRQPGLHLSRGLH